MSAQSSPSPLLAASQADLALTLGAALDEAPELAPDLRVAWLPAPPGALDALAMQRVGEHSVLWAPSAASGAAPCFVGLGAARVVRTGGLQRLTEARRAIEDAFAHRAVAVSDGKRGPRGRWPRFWGGASFVPGQPVQGCWESFGEATFVLPRWNYVDEGEAAWLGVVYDPEKDGRDDLLAEAQRLWSTLAEPPAAAPPPAVTVELEHRESTSAAEWTALIDSIHAGIQSGAFHKVVAARCSTLRLSPAPDPAAVFRRLGQLAPGCARFALRIGERTFLGATPERLVSRQGRRIDTEAIAGSVAADVEQAAERLLSSAKNRAEHEYVVTTIQNVLSPLCAELHVPAEPSVRRLRHVLHLQTPIRGVLAEDVHLLELADRLHPTPAVGGVPTERALDWIVRSEHAERGWYASPIGWVDAAGDGELLVALRSALIREDRVHLYAGAGIVAASEASSEYAETEVKLAGMRAALGVQSSAAQVPAEQTSAGQQAPGVGGTHVAP